ncbi:MAG: lysylphosphatidylglycerol synthase domain-containing protein [Kiloniellales bacterium]
MGLIRDLRRPARIVASLLFILAAAVFVLTSSDRVHFPAFSLISVAAFALALLVNVLMAGVRFESLASRHGTRIGLLKALQANAAAALASQFVFAFMGQAAGRAAVLHKSGLSASATISLSLIERIIAALVLGTAAIFAALFLFGRLTAGNEIDPSYFFRVLACLLIAAAVPLGTVYQSFVPRAAKGLFSRQVGEDLLIVGGLSVLVHLAMLAAYAALAVGLGAALNAELIAACLVVMFAASLPISFGGWGVREISAGFALSLVGLSVVEGVAIGAAIGVGSLAVQLGVAALSMAKRPGVEARPEPEERAARPDYALWLGLLTPVLASFAVIFGLHLSLQDSVINLNLADPLAILGGMLFVAYWFEQRRLPLWQVRRFNLILLVLTGVMAFAALHGLLSFGYSSWGIRNRFIGWFVLLAFMATGALFVVRLGTAGREILLKGFVVALCTVAGLEFLVELAAHSGLGIARWSRWNRFEAFSQNANAYAFLLLAGVAVVIALLRKGAPRIWALCGGVLLAALLFTLSRAGWGGAVILIVAAAAIDRRLLGPLIDMVLAGAAFVGLFLGLLALIEYVPQVWLGLTSGEGISSRDFRGLSLFRSPVSTEYSDDARMITLRGGWALWTANPLFGAGLGAYFEESGGSGKALTIHNSFLWIAAETGLAGLGLFVAGGLSVIAAFWRRLKDPADEAATTLFLLALCFTGMAMVHDFMYQRILWFIAGACLALPPAKTQ